MDTRRCDFCHQDVEVQSIIWRAGYEHYVHCAACGHSHEQFICYECVCKPAHREVADWYLDGHMGPVAADTIAQQLRLRNWSL